MSLAIAASQRGRSSSYTDVSERENLPKINYESMVRICQLKEGKSHYNIDHAKFMKEYPKIFLSPTGRKRPDEARWRSLSAQSKRSVHQTIPVLNLRTGTRSHSKKSDSLLKTRLKGIAAIVQKHPPLRTLNDIKELVSLIHHFPSLFDPGSAHSPQVLEAIAARAVLETVRDRNGIALPRDGGVYLILCGTVQELDYCKKPGEPHKYTKRILGPGDVFGELKEPLYPPKHSYPIYLGYSRCHLMRITVTDYIRAKQVVEERENERKLRLVEESPVLGKFPQNIRQRLAKLISWKILPPSTKLLHEGESFSKISVVKNGQLRVLKTVPGCSPNTTVCIGQIGEGGCIGELYFDGTEISPYTVVSTTSVTIGQIETKDLLGIDIRESRAPSQKIYSVPVPSEEDLREAHAHKLITKEWTSLKRSLVSGIYREKGQ